MEQLRPEEPGSGDLCTSREDKGGHAGCQGNRGGISEMDGNPCIPAHALQRDTICVSCWGDNRDGCGDCSARGNGDRIRPRCECLNLHRSRTRRIRCRRDDLCPDHITLVGDGDGSCCRNSHRWSLCPELVYARWNTLLILELCIDPSHPLNRLLHRVREG